MTEPNPGARWSSPEMQQRLRRRHRDERRFRRAGTVAIGLALLGLAALLASIAATGWSAFRTTEIQLDVVFDPALFEGVADAPAGRARRAARGRRLLRAGAQRAPLAVPRGRGPPAAARAGGPREHGRARGAARGRDRRSRADRRRRARSGCSPTTRSTSIARARLSRETAEADRNLTDAQLAWIDQLVAQGRVRTAFATRFLTSGDSREPELAGIWGAVVGSFLTLVVTLIARLSARRLGGRLPGGVRAAQPLHRPDRGEHQQPGGGALDRVRPARARRVPGLLLASALRAARGRPHARA